MLSLEDREKLKRANYWPMTFFDPDVLLNEGQYESALRSLDYLVYAQDSTADVSDAAKSIRKIVERLKQMTQVLSRPQLVQKIEDWSDLRGCYWNVSAETLRPEYRCGDDIIPILDEVDAILETLHSEGYGQRGSFEYLTELHKKKRSEEIVSIFHEEASESEKRRLMDYVTGHLRGRSTIPIGTDTLKEPFDDWDDYRILVALANTFPDEVKSLVSEIRETSKNMPLIVEIAEHWYCDHGPTQDVIWAAERRISRGNYGLVFLSEAAQKGIVDLKTVLEWMMSRTEHPYSRGVELSYSLAAEMGVLFGSSVSDDELPNCHGILDKVKQISESDQRFAYHFHVGLQRGRDSLPG